MYNLCRERLITKYYQVISRFTNRSGSPHPEWLCIETFDALHH